MLLSGSLADPLSNVAARRAAPARAGLIALAVGAVVGYSARVAARAPDPPAGARGRADRERALRRAVVDAGHDEVGELAAAFERMRGRLAKLDRARREFIANASHELRTPLFSLGGFLELMADEELDEPTRQEFLATMREQVRA